jgi:alpha-mannosidase
MPPVTVCVPPKPGDLPRQGSLAEVRPAGLQVLALKPAEDGDGWILRLQETAGQAARASLTWLGRKLALGSVPAGAIASWRLRAAAGAWRAERVNSQEW